MMSEEKLKQLQEQRKRVHANQTTGKIAFNYGCMNSELKAKGEETFEEKQQRIKQIAERINKLL